MKTLLRHPPLPSFACLLCMAASGLLVGCTDPGPLDDDQPRTPYTQYRQLRGDDPPLTKENALGETRPNLRGRLLPDGTNQANQ